MIFKGGYQQDYCNPCDTQRGINTINLTSVILKGVINTITVTPVIFNGVNNTATVTHVILKGAIDTITVNPVILIGVINTITVSPMILKVLEHILNFRHNQTLDPSQSRLQRGFKTRYLHPGIQPYQEKHFQRHSASSVLALSTYWTK